MSYHSDNLIEAANCLNSYVDLENELIKLAGFNLRTLIDKLKAGYTLQEPTSPYTNTTETATISLNDYINLNTTAPEATLNGGVDGYVVERYVPVQPSDADYESSPCVHCSNNPKNGGSGVCHCILGQRVIC